MGALLGLMLGTGVLLIWRSGSRAPARRTSSGHRWRRRRVDLLRQAGVDGVGSAQLFGVQLVCALLAGLVVLLVTSTLAVAVCFAGFAFAAPVAVLRRMRRRRMVALRELWPEAVDNLASAVRAGMSLPEGLSALALRGPEPLRPAFARFGSAYRASGRFGRCLDALKDDLADPVGDRVCETMRVAREVGGSDLGAVLRALSELLRADARTRAELETRQGWVVNTEVSTPAGGTALSVGSPNGGSVRAVVVAGRRGVRTRCWLAAGRRWAALSCCAAPWLSRVG